MNTKSLKKPIILTVSLIYVRDICLSLILPKAEEFPVFSFSENDKVQGYKYLLNYPGKGS
jgi:hypothetical protein